MGWDKEIRLEHGLCRSDEFLHVGTIDMLKSLLNLIRFLRQALNCQGC